MVQLGDGFSLVDKTLEKFGIHGQVMLHHFYGHGHVQARVNTTVHDAVGAAADDLRGDVLADRPVRHGPFRIEPAGDDLGEEFMQFRMLGGDTVQHRPVYRPQLNVCFGLDVRILGLTG